MKRGVDWLNIKLGDRIKRIRLSKGLNQSQFGESFEPAAARSIVSRWESGKSVPNAKRLRKIAELGGISVSELLNGSIDELIDSTADYLYSVYSQNFDENSMPKTDGVKSLIHKINTHEDTSTYEDQDFVSALSIILTIDNDEYVEDSVNLNIKRGIAYCASEVKRKLNGWGPSDFSRSRILFHFQSAADDHIYGYTPDNHGLLMAARDGINTTILQLQEIANAFGDPDLKKLPKGIDKNFYKELERIFNGASDKITTLFSKYE
jgi:transcriptional regulator with XRE-family HTH domain